MTSAQGYTICGQGPAVVLLHSSMSSKDQWKPLMSKLAPRFKLLAIDLAGYGDNTLPAYSNTFSIDDELSLVLRVMAEQLDSCEQFHLIGHSYGGAVGLKLAVAMRHRIKTLTLFEPVAFHLLPPHGPAHVEITALAEQFNHALAKKDKTPATQLFIDYWSGKGTFEKLAPGNKAVLIHCIEKILLDFTALFNESLTLADYATLTIPVCLIRGEKSPVTSVQIFMILKQVFPDLSTHSVPGGHMSPITHVKQVNAIIEKFLLSHALG